jgi:hypothetical protein
MEFKKYLTVVVDIYHKTTQEEIEAWFESAKAQSMYQWTEHVLIYEDWKKVLGKFKPKKNFRMIPKTETFWQNPESILIDDWDISDIRQSRDNEIKLAKLWKKDAA